MQILKEAFNIDLLILNENSKKSLLPISVTDINEASSRNFHPKGLFSTEIFGRVGDERRNRLFAYIDMKADIFHPVVYKALCDLKRLYGEIMASSSYAIWDTNLKDFVKCEPGDGDTGYHYFLSHFHELVFEQRPSVSREFNIKLVNKYREKCLMNTLIVMPAGLRDFEIDDNGKPTDNEINDFYRRVMGMSNLITLTTLKMNPEALDRTRHNMQVVVYELYCYIKNLLEGKKKFVLSKFGARKIFNGTRNVITSVNADRDELDDDTAISTQNTVVGLYQFMKATLPVASFHIKTGFISKVFLGNNSPAVLVNKKTLKKEMVHVDPEDFDEWMTDEGLEKTITRFAEEDMRHLPLTVSGRYIGLTYRGADGTFALFQDIDDLPTGFDKERATPTTYCELLYTAVYAYGNTIPAFVTRYPISGYGSIYPSYCYVKTTVKGERRKELDPDNNWQPKEGYALEFPITGEQFTNSIAPSNRHLQRLGAD